MPGSVPVLKPREVVASPVLLRKIARDIGLTVEASTAPTDDDDQTMRAVVFITEGTSRGTARSPQEYATPLLVLCGQTYATIPFEELHQLICDALRGDRPRLVAEVRGPGGGSRLLFEGGSVQGTGRG